MMRGVMLRAAVAICSLLTAPAVAEPTLLAAASTSGAVDAAISQSGIAAVTSYGASGGLARQIEQGAPADLFISANPKWMTYLIDAGLVQEDAVLELMSNALVLIGPKGAASIEPDDLPTALDGENFVMADPESAPVGAYGKASLQALGVWDGIQDGFVPVRNTLATLTAVSTGEAAYGLVYSSDTALDEGVSIVARLPKDSHPPIQYLIAPVSQGEDAVGAMALTAYLMSPEGQDVLAGYGFVTGPEGM
ncbi:molybdate ABC transporter substrate-binding protein [Donghicola sp. C2-DW-16]|uniref:Molybdate ABC transporter substrate-binding protein n=1 Tax=Donghicola mangrovi TaxID=2729614 RepID=A0ABX2PG27_9RHOB|nr:molybdate ABC transporter substrate-binding protein [Donghicola mangrovi]NVO28145.1 molybdate ABC transporter substrate-binding protein [Donghicola mangrovi]